MGLAATRRDTTSGGGAASPSPGSRGSGRRREARGLRWRSRSLTCLTWRVSASTARSTAAARSPAVSSLLRIRRFATSVMRAVLRYFSADSMTLASMIFGRIRASLPTFRSTIWRKAGVTATP